MKLQDYFKVLSEFRSEICKVVDLIDPMEIEYDTADPDEKFLYDELTVGVFDNILYAKDVVDYLSKKISYKGCLKTNRGYFYIDEIKLQENDTVEVLVNNEWRRVDVLFFKNEYYISLEAGSQIVGLEARIRLTEKEVDMRKAV